MSRPVSCICVHLVFIELLFLPGFTGVPIRLNGPSSTQCSGTVEVFYNRTWGTVCDNGWDLNDAMVVCRQLGCGAAKSAPLSAHFGEGSDQIWLDDVACSGSESSITQCKHRGFGTHSCAHSDDAGVVCSGFEVRLVGPWATRCSGRVEIFHSNAWGTICDDGWDLKDAKLVCRQLDCGTAVNAPGWAHFGEGTGKIWLHDVSCSGRESSLSECQHGGFGQSNCGHDEDAGVVCSAASIPNVAPSGTASQSGTVNGGNASFAIDGSRNPYYYNRSCTHTRIRWSHWWSVLLPAVYRITHLSVTNRDRGAERINNAELLIGNSQENYGNSNPRCNIIYSITHATTRDYNCGGMMGQLVNVKLVGPYGTLSMCEVEVYGEMAAPTFSAVVMGRNVEVVQKKLCWSDALFYCRDFYWDLLSVRSEEEQREVEKVLRDTSFPLTKHVWFGLRRYLRGDTWFWMSGDSTNFNYLETESVWENTTLCGGVDTSDRFLWKDFPCDEHLHFICLKDLQKDDERVEFFSSTRP